MRIRRLSLALALLGAAVASHAVDLERLTPRERADPLEPWSLEPGRDVPPGPKAGPVSPPTPVPGVPPAVPPGDTLASIPRRPVPPATGPEPAPAPVAPGGAADASERVTIVELQQLLVADPALAHRLWLLLDAGKPLEEARQSLGRIEIESRRRKYALDDLAPEVRAEVEQMPVEGWSRVRPWKGRSSLFQLLAREEGLRGTLPQLGQGLGAEEQQRLASLRRPAPARARPNPGAESADFQPAAVTQQKTPEYPPTATTSGRVTVEVEVGLTGDVVEVRIVSSDDPLFEPAALKAARESVYRPARRTGVPERGTVTLNFQFVAPPAPGMTPPGEPPPGQPPSDQRPQD